MFVTLPSKVDDPRDKLFKRLFFIEGLKRILGNRGGRELSTSTIMCPRCECLNGGSVFQGCCLEASRRTLHEWTSGHGKSGSGTCFLRSFCRIFDPQQRDRGHWGMLLNEFPPQSRSSLVGSFKQFEMKRQVMGGIIEGDFSVSAGIVVMTHISKEPRVSNKRPRGRGHDALSHVAASPRSYDFARGGGGTVASSRGGGRHLSLELSEIGRPRNR